MCNAQSNAGGNECTLNVAARARPASLPDLKTILNTFKSGQMSLKSPKSELRMWMAGPSSAYIELLPPRIGDSHAA